MNKHCIARDAAEFLVFVYNRVIRVACFYASSTHGGNGGNGCNGGNSGNGGNVGN